MTPRRPARASEATDAVVAFCVGGASSLVARSLLRSHPPGGAGRWTRSNHAGCPVTLLEGPAYAVGAVSGALSSGLGGPAAVAGLGAAALGVLDDFAGESSSKGLRGHLAAARRGDLTTGMIKIVGLGVTGLAAAWMVDRSRPRTGTRVAGSSVTGALDTLVGGAVIAGSANLVNLLDLRPGRALKVVLLAVPLVAGRRGNHVSTTTAAATAGAAMAALPDDLAGQSMLGDTGANSAGALLGTALVARADLPGRLLALAALTVLTLASEKVSFTKVIESSPILSYLDALGRPSQPSLTAIPTSTP